MSKIISVVGARPQFIKAAVVSRAFRGAGGIRELLVHTGQHYDANMSDIFFEELGISPPFRHLGIGGGSHGAQTGLMLGAIEQIIMDESPSLVVVYGDTNSTLAGALAAAKLHVPVAHVEAGLRSHNLRMPEEINRILTDRLSTVLFTPTADADANLLREGAPAERIRRVGDVMLDAVLHMKQTSSPETQNSRRYALATIHRAETTDDPERLRAVVEGLRRVARTLPVILPLHPRTRGAVEKSGVALDGLEVRNPVGYREMAALQSRAAVIITDSGGVQKEAFFHSVPCVTVRTETEWAELVRGGWNRLAETGSPDDIEATVMAALGGSFPPPTPLFGDGRAGEKIVEEISALLSSRKGPVSWGLPAGP
jgi:UDP-GlcNAc3NAcA epimerase